MLHLLKGPLNPAGNPTLFSKDSARVSWGIFTQNLFSLLLETKSAPWEKDASETNESRASIKTAD
ncbi:ORF1231 [White spot syndrome virus]|uniref:Wsv046 n=3 Tax=White spot syndrome virus TaxID=342409 RepID=Q8VBC1_WSSVS|nr:wsv046 [Shrimp white spot syndrome virus]AFX59423.1 wsv046 [White spot syndrome virus]AAL33050.1 wsv046 [Shrimp white spot syndrome virus]AAL88971.1 WSSV103 [Shrimp white spot syndrome virus]ATU84121.1 ORF1231 [White spot syndrome virus]AWQ60235.1 wsv046 [Shrimp white spot syndrome virus]